MQHQLFRKQSLDHIASPEQLHDYMHVTSPRLWMLLAAIAALLVGFLVYASTATLENTLPVRVEVSSMVMENGETNTIGSFSLPMDQRDLVQVGMSVRVAGVERAIDFMYQDEEQVAYILTLSGLTQPLPDGLYDAQVVTEATTPISFLLN